MAYAFKHYTPEQIKGYKVSLFLKFYNKQPIKNPVGYIRQMRKRWGLSEEWANKLLGQNNLTIKPPHFNWQFYDDKFLFLYLLIMATFILLL